MDPREEEIKELRRKIRTLETEPNQAMNENATNQTKASKNGEPTQRETGQNIEEMHKMKDFLVGVMSAINAFEKKLTTQIGLEQTRSDRS